ncbi:MAG: DUF4135 domain-containing protein [Actinomycetota bacterium]
MSYTKERSLLGVSAPYDIASRASNLAEQIRIVQALAGRVHLGVSPPELTSVDSWRLRRLARKLAGGPSREPLRDPQPRGSAEELEAVLAANRLLQLRSGDLGEAERAVLADVHGAWLSTYTAALDGLYLSSGEASTAGRVAGKGHHQRLALACRPFLAYIRSQLGAATREANHAAGRDLFGAEMVEAFEEHLIARFELSLAWTIEADTNVTFERLGISRESASTTDHDDYFNRTFQDAASYHAFYRRFPVLGRLLATVTRQLCDNGRTLIERLHRDAEDIGAALFGEPIAMFTGLQPGKSDYHAGGRSVAIASVALAGSGQGAFVYKPRCLRSEAAMQGLLARLTADGVIGFAPHRVMARDGYGYEQLIPSGHNRVQSREQAGKVYEELGGFLGIFHVLGGSDLHYENVLVADGHIFVCDCETVLAVVPSGQEPAVGTVLDSVYRTGLLEWPLSLSADIVLRLSGCSGGQSYEIPFALPRLQQGPSLAVKHETGIRVEQEAANRIHLDGNVLDPQDFEEAIVSGFSQVYDWFQHNATEAIRRLRALFEGASVRFVSRSTQAYTQLLIAARHPKCLMEPLEVDLVIDRLRQSPLRWDPSGLAAASEARSLWQLDVPTFSAAASGTELVHDHAEPVQVELERSPLELATERVLRLSTDSRLQQVGYISASLSLAEVHSPSFVSTALEYARLVGWELQRWLDDPFRSRGWSDQAAAVGSDDRGSLYYGSAGIALFFAYLDWIDPREAFRAAAERAVEHAMAHQSDQLGHSRVSRV